MAEKNIENKLREIISDRSIKNKEKNKDGIDISKKLFESYLSKKILESHKEILEIGKDISCWHFKKDDCLEIISLQVKNGFSEYAINIAKKIDEKYPKLDVFSRIVSTYAEIGKIEEAKEIAEMIKEIEDKEQYRLALSDIALAQSNKGMKEEAKNTFDKMMKEIEDIGYFMFDEEMYASIALRQAKAGMKEEAKNTFNIATKQIEDSLDTESFGYAELAEVQAESGFFEDALETAGKSYKTEKIVLGYCKVAENMAKAGMKEEAKEIFRKIPEIKRFEDYEESWNYYTIGVYQAVAGFFEDALETADKNIGYKNDLYDGVISEQAEAGLISEAIEKLKERENEISNYLNIASAQIKKGMTKQARGTLKKALQLAKDDDKNCIPYIHNEIALSYVKEGVFEKAKKSLEFASKNASNEYHKLSTIKTCLEAFNQTKAI